MEKINNNLYLYCFFSKSRTCRRLVQDEISNGNTLNKPAACSTGIDGINDTIVLSHNDLCALVSPVSSDEYSEESLEQHIQDLEWLTPKVKIHENIIRSIMEGHSVLPMRFGIIYTSVEGILNVLKANYDGLSSFFDYIADKEEWGIKVYADELAGVEAIANSYEAIKQLDKQIASVPQGQAYLLKKKRESLIRQYRGGYLRKLSDELYEQMSGWTVDGRKNKVLSNKATGRDADMILNAAFLINENEIDSFKDRLNDLASSYQDGILFEISGPWPCYNFCPELGQ